MTGVGLVVERDNTCDHVFNLIDSPIENREMLRVLRDTAISPV
jgi:hypothetical protein